MAMPHLTYAFIYWWTLWCMYLFEIEVLSFPDICPGVGLLNHLVILFVATPLFFLWLRLLYVVLPYWPPCRSSSLSNRWLSHSLFTSSLGDTFLTPTGWRPNLLQVFPVQRGLTWLPASVLQAAATDPARLIPQTLFFPPIAFNIFWSTI